MNLRLRNFLFLANILDWALLLILVALTFRLLFYLSPALNGSGFSGFIDQLFEPYTDLLKSFSKSTGFPIAVKGFNLSLFSAFVILVAIRNILNWQVLKIKMEKVIAGVSQIAESRDSTGESKEETARRIAAERRLAIQSYTEAKVILEASQQSLTFVALDVVGSTRMKIGEDPIVIEQTFLTYQKMIEHLLQRFQAYKSTWTPDGQMAAFKTPELGILFAKAVLGALPEFNQKSLLKTPFRLRVGVNTGMVSTDDATPMEKISSFCIDLTGHLQKYAEPDTMWVSEHTWKSLADRDGFVPGEKKVDDTQVYTWKIA